MEKKKIKKEEIFCLLLIIPIFIGVLISLFELDYLIEPIILISVFLLVILNQILLLKNNNKYYDGNEKVKIFFIAYVMEYNSVISKKEKHKLFGYTNNLEDITETLKKRGYKVNDIQNYYTYYNNSKSKYVKNRIKEIKDKIGNSNLTFNSFILSIPTRLIEGT